MISELDYSQVSQLLKELAKAFKRFSDKIIET